MNNITYSLGGTSFDAVPQMAQSFRTPVRSDATIGRAIVHSIGLSPAGVQLSGEYMSPEVREAVYELFQQSRKTGEPVIFNDGYIEREVIITAFETSPLIGETEGFSFRIELLILG